MPKMERFFVVQWRWPRWSAVTVATTLAIHGQAEASAAWKKASRRHRRLEGMSSSHRDAAQKPGAGGERSRGREEEGCGRRWRRRGAKKPMSAAVLLCLACDAVSRKACAARESH